MEVGDTEQVIEADVAQCALRCQRKHSQVSACSSSVAALTLSGHLDANLIWLPDESQHLNLWNEQLHYCLSYLLYPTIASKLLTPARQSFSPSQVPHHIHRGPCADHQKLWPHRSRQSKPKTFEHTTCPQTTPTHNSTRPRAASSPTCSAHLIASSRVSTPRPRSSSLPPTARMGSRCSGTRMRMCRWTRGLTL
jgi:hypothetical protein